MNAKRKQIYEEYWKLTLEYSDIHSKRFVGTLRIIINFIDENRGKKYSDQLYKELQNKVYAAFPKNMASIRKSINQFIKLGFVNFQLKSYHEDAPPFLEAKTKRRRASLFSKIVYTNSSFNRSVTNDSKKKEINFLLKTLEMVGTLRKENILALMTIDITKVHKGYLNAIELNKALIEAAKNRFFERKYNQISYLINILSKLDDVVFVYGELCFKEDVEVIFGEDLDKIRQKRDSYLHRIYKNQLKEESYEKVGAAKCMLEELDYPTLVASHIKPFLKSSEKESYDPNNGLLLSGNMDALFDKGYISFDKSGKIILSARLSKDLKNHLKNYSLRKIFLNQERLGYLQYHKAKVFSNKKRSYVA